MASSAAASISSSLSVCLGRPLFDLERVERTPLWICFMWPISVAYSTPICFLIAVASKPGHPRRKPISAAAINDDFGWEHKLAW